MFGVAITDVAGLKIAAAVERTMLPAPLDGREVRVFRKLLGLSGVEFARKLQVTPETVSRWENGKESLKPHTEKVLRGMVGKELHQSAPGVFFDIGRVFDLQIDAEVERTEMRFARVLHVGGQHTESWANAA